MKEQTTTGASPSVDKEYSVEGFEGVEVSTVVEFEITRSADYSVRATGPEELIKRLDVEVSGRTLTVRLGSKVRLWPERIPNGHVNVFITMPGLRRLAVSGACRGTAKGFTSAEDFDLELSGASQVEVEMEARNAAVHSSGAGTVTGELKVQRARLAFSGAGHCELGGRAHNLDLDLSGKCRVDLSRFEIHDANAALSGASWAGINISGTLNAQLSGACSLEYTGSGVAGRVKTSGASKVEKK